ncbi:MAG TPA: DUF935 family protein [Rariglobus sp.]|nr:DUF935 family protein [Rariglobus sp.]
MSKPAKQTVSAERVRRHVQNRSNPVARLTPAKLARILDAFDAGNIRDAALLWQRILERDDQAITCSGKRIRGTPGLNWEILTLDKSPEAQQHKEALEYFYRNVAVRNALERNERGGLRLLIKQILSAIGLRFAAHEIVWQPGEGGRMTAQFNFIPLQFFENTTGELRFLETDEAQTGTAMDEKFGPDGWMVACGDGLMRGGSVAYQLKRTPLYAWVNYCDKFGTPPLHGQTDAAKGSDEWNTLRDALAGYGEDLALITSLAAKISPLELKNAGNTPHPALVDRMDRAVSRIWTGGDLSTMSQGGGGAVGSEPQQDDLGKLQAEDAAMVTDTLQEYVDRVVIRYLFGTDQPLAYFELQTPAKLDTERELKIDTFLIGAGVPRGKRELQERYNRPEMEDDDEAAEKSGTVPGFGGVPAINEAANAKAALFKAGAIKSLQAAQLAAFRPLITRIANVADLPDDEFDTALVQLRADLPGMAGQILSKDSTGALAKVWESILGPALVSGAAEAAKRQAK